MQQTPAIAEVCYPFLRAPADGYTLLFFGSSAANRRDAVDKLNFIRDIVPVAGIARDTFAIEVNPSVPVNTVPEFIAYAKIKFRQDQYGLGRHRFRKPYFR